MSACALFPSAGDTECSCVDMHARLRLHGMHAARATLVPKLIGIIRSANAVCIYNGQHTPPHVHQHTAVRELHADATNSAEEASWTTSQSLACGLLKDFENLQLQKTGA